MSADVALLPHVIARGNSSARSPLMRMPSVGAVDMPAESVMNSLMDAWPPRCAHVVGEILQTEQAYLNALEDILEVRPGCQASHACTHFLGCSNFVGVYMYM